MAHARGKHRPLRGTPETTCHPAQARVGSLTDGLSARCRTPNDVHRRRKGRNTWLDRGGAAVADCRGRRPHAPLSPLFPAPNLPAFPPPAKCSRADTIRVTQPVSPAAPRSVPSSGPNPHNRTRPESPRRNRASTGVSRRLAQYPHASECCQACAGRRAAVPRSPRGHSGAVRAIPLQISPGRFFRGAAMAGARTRRQGRGDLGKQGIPASWGAGFSMQFLRPDQPIHVDAGSPPDAPKGPVD